MSYVGYTYLASIVTNCIIHLIVIGGLVLSIVINGIVNITFSTIGLVVKIYICFSTLIFGVVFNWPI